MQQWSVYAAYFFPHAVINSSAYPGGNSPDRAEQDQHASVNNESYPTRYVYIRYSYNAIIPSTFYQFAANYLTFQPSPKQNKPRIPCRVSNPNSPPQYLRYKWSGLLFNRTRNVDHVSFSIFSTIYQSNVIQHQQCEQTIQGNCKKTCKQTVPPRSNILFSLSLSLLIFSHLRARY